ncbi:hypothetical protein ACH4SP_26755 [Streptomyces sp. NPDC021093]|uniref:hypothetical protein n=1 Tax=Streptomyces sp. NPDC021093 TaxID=3365112 RepID=UPI003792360A
MTTRLMRPRGGTVRTVLLTLVFLFLVPLFGVEGPADSVSARPVSERSATAFVPSTQADSRDEGRGCHEGQPGDSHGAVAPCPEQPTSHIPRATHAPPGPQDDSLGLPGASPPDITSVDLYRIQIIRT